MKFNKFIIIFLLLFVLTKLTAQGYHAGDITYTWLNGYTYRITLTTLTSIGGSGLSDPCEDSLCFGDGTQALVLRNNGICSGACSPACEGVPLPSGTIKLNEYTTTHTYSGPGNYNFCFNDRNRNSGVVNIPNSVNQVMSFESLLVIPTFAAGNNSSPVFVNLPIAYGCINNGCYTYNPLATDANGDSLSYSVLSCLNPGASIPTTGSGGIFTINPITGLLTWCNPQLQGDYNVIIKITEWRKDSGGNYFVIGCVNRDTQLTITSCTGIKEMGEEKIILSVFPNPITENFTITFNKNSNELFTIDLIDVTGRKIKTFVNNESLAKENTFQLKLENINHGIYFLKITGNYNTNITKKIIKQ